MGGLAIFLLVILSVALTSLILVIAYAAGLQLNPFWTFLAVFLLLLWLVRRM